MKFGFELTTTDLDTLWNDEEVDAVVIATRHDSHAQLVCAALAAGKHVFVEKPLCLSMDELAEIEAARARCGKMVMVGFNRRFSPHARKIKDLLGSVSGPKSFIMTVNSGAIPTEHWTQDLEVGGGRIIGEACHFIDLLRFLAGASITRRDVFRMDSAAADTITITLGFADGSIGTVHYFSNGSRTFPKERLEVFASGRILQLDNFRKLRGYGWPNLTTMNLWRQDKGQRDCGAAFVESIARGGSAPIPLSELVEVARASIQLAEAAR